MKKRICSLVLFVSIATSPLSILGHSGRTDSNGGHHDRSNGTYHYHNGGGSSPAPSPSTAPIPQVSTPRNIKVIAKPTIIIISWDIIDDATGYIVSVNGDVRETTETTIIYDGLAPNQKYEYAVRAKKGTTLGNYSVVSSVTTLPKPVEASPAPVAEKRPEKVIRVRVNDDFIDFEGNNPVILNERVLIPVRPVLEKMGYLVLWDKDTKVLQIVKDLSLQVTVKNKANDNIVVYVDGTLVDFGDQAPVLINDRLLVPIRFIVEKLDCTVTWDNVQYIVDIKK